jgi:hypothetical protein
MAAVLKTAMGSDTHPGFESLALRSPPAKRLPDLQERWPGSSRFIDGRSRSFSPGPAVAHSLRQMRGKVCRQDQRRWPYEIYVRMPTPEEVNRLQLDLGTPVACHICTGLTEDGTPVRVVINVLPGDRHIIVFVFERRKVHEVGA